MKTYRTMLFVVLFALPAFGQSPSKNGPTVKETLHWIQTSLEDGGGDYSVKHETRSIRLQDFSGCEVHFVYTTHQEPYMNGEPAPEPDKKYRLDYFFRLGDIDPTSIIFTKGTPNRWDVPAFVTIATTNEEKKITRRFPWDSEAEAKPDATYLMFTIDPIDADYVVRFTKAFKHAVEACGGKSSTF